MFYKCCLHRTMIKQSTPRFLKKFYLRFSSIIKPVVSNTKIRSSHLARGYMYTHLKHSIHVRSYDDHHHSTIFSLSSGHGKCGVAVIRVSGTSACHAMETIAQMKKKLIKPRKATLRRLFDPFTSVTIDMGLVLYFPGPQSFTGEDCVEFQVHGGPAVVSALLSALHKIPNCRQAEPGEFTMRAFFNGKMDLTEIEGLGDLIHAETEAQRRQALRQMDGDLSKLYTQWRTKIIKCVADMEAFIDFSEDQNIEDSVIEQVKKNVDDLCNAIRNHINDNRQGELLREGVHVVILGQPNVGKSSLLNAICQRPAAIVTNVAGTTRDLIETCVNIGGYPVLLSDTAGLRDTTDIVEKEGVSRALQRAKEADLKIIVLDVMNQDINTDSDISKLIYDQFKELVVSNNRADSEMSSKLSDFKETSNSIKDDTVSSKPPSTEKNVNNMKGDIKEVSSKSDLLKNVESIRNVDDLNQHLNDTNTIIVFNKIDLAEPSDILNLENNINSSAVGLHTPLTNMSVHSKPRTDACSINEKEMINEELDSDKTHVVEQISERTTGANCINNNNDDNQATCNTSQISVSIDDLHNQSVERLKHEETIRTPCCFISCTNGDGMEDFLNILTSKVADLCGNPLTGHPSLTQSRHRNHLLKCLSYMEEFKSLSDHNDLVLASETLRWSLQEIGKITGRISSEDILDVIFKDFCIGK
ncbi:tRNA modification GTPase gtpbp3 [Mactra antiquata]